MWAREKKSEWRETGLSVLQVVNVSSNAQEENVWLKKDEKRSIS
jgi:hypothetical protein